jgi:hypothetical protein
MSLESWCRQGLLSRLKPTRARIRNLLALADRDLEKCQTPELGSDWQLAIAYNAALQCATAALAACGYRTTPRAGHHLRAVESLALTIAWDASSVTVLDRLRQKRNVIEYERSGAVSSQEVREMVKLARKLRADVQAWLEAHHPHFL